MPSRKGRSSERRDRLSAAMGVGLLACLLASCVVTREPDDRSDSTTSVTVSLDTMPPLPAAPAARLDSTVAAIDRSVARTVEATDTLVATGEASLGSASTDSTPTAADLEALSAELIMPLAEVKPEELHDTFNEPRGGGTRTHEALDIMAARGTPVLSAAAGRVLKLHTSNAGGLMVYAANSTDRFVLMYAHLDAYADGLRDGLPLRRGQVLGYVGTTGNAPPNAPHLHFAIAYPRDVNLWWTGVPVDPRPLLQRRSGTR